MKRTILITTAAIAAASVSALPALGHDRGKGHHESYSAGEPGDPAKPSRTIEIEMSEMDYNPFKIEVKRGEQLRFVLRNVGTEDHEFLLATTKENLAHAAVGSVPETWVTFQSEDIGNPFGPKGFARGSSLQVSSSK